MCVNESITEDWRGMKGKRKGERGRVKKRESPAHVMLASTGVMKIVFIAGDETFGFYFKSFLAAPTRSDDTANSKSGPSCHPNKRLKITPGRLCAGWMSGPSMPSGRGAVSRRL